MAANSARIIVNVYFNSKFLSADLRYFLNIQVFSMYVAIYYNSKTTTHKK